MLTRVVISGCLLMVACDPAFCQTSIVWKFNKGDTFFVEESSVYQGTLSPKENPRKFDGKSNKLMEFIVKDQTTNGCQLEMRIHSWVQRSKDDEPDSNSLLRYEKAAKDAKLKLEISLLGTIKKIEGVQDYVKKLNEMKKPFRYFADMMTDDEFLYQLPLAFSVSSEVPVKPGDKWKRDASVNLNIIAKSQFALEFSYKEQVADKAKCDISADIDFMPLKGLTGVWTFEPKARKAEGKMVFDTKNSKLVSMELNVPIIGLSLLDKVGAVEYEAKMQWSIHVYDKNPRIKNN